MDRPGFCGGGNRWVSRGVILGVMGPRIVARVILATAVAVFVTGCSSGGTEQSAPTTTTATRDSTALTIRETPRPIVALTVAQLHAQLGTSVPRGWAPVDYGAARVWAPANWSVADGNACSGGTSVSDTVSLGQLAQAPCRALGTTTFVLPGEAVSLIPLTSQHVGTAFRVVNGYRVYPANASKPDPTWRLYNVPQLGVRIALRGRLAPTILDSIAPSARTVALAYAVLGPPSNYRSIAEDGVSLSIPQTWTVTSDPLPGASSNSVLVVPSTHPSPDAGPSSPIVPSADAADVVAGGASLSQRPSRTGDVYGHRIATLVHGSTVVKIYDGYGDVPNAVDISIRRGSSPILHVLHLGFGRDGRTAGGILASLQATT
jgi:hypothetical protein